MIPQHGMRIVESPAACTYERVRKYPRSHAKSPRHFARMDKKWAKRYGTKMVPAAYPLGDGVLVVHPMLAAEYRRAIKQTFQPWSVFR